MEILAICMYALNAEPISSSILLPINNGGFELDTMPNGNPIPIQTFIYGSPVITDWTVYDPNSISKPGTFGVANPTDSGQFTINKAPEGNLNAWIWSDKTNRGEIGIIQTLSHIVTQGIKYTLIVFVGNPSSGSWSAQSSDGAFSENQVGFPGYKIDLLADNNVLATDDNTLLISDGTWKQSIISINITSSNGYIGQRFGIRLINLNQGNGREVSFDAVEFHATPIVYNNPTKNPTTTPSKSPTKFPSKSPSKYPTKYPTTVPTKSPTNNPSVLPTKYPTISPIYAYITPTPTAFPTELPTSEQISEPTQHPTEIPTDVPTPQPTQKPSRQPQPTSQNITVSTTLDPLDPLDSLEATVSVTTPNPTITPTIYGPTAEKTITLSPTTTNTVISTENFIITNKVTVVITAMTHTQNSIEQTSGTENRIEAVTLIDESNISMNLITVYIVGISVLFICGIMLCIYMMHQKKQKQRHKSVEQMGSYPQIEGNDHHSMSMIVYEMNQANNAVGITIKQHLVDTIKHNLSDSSSTTPPPGLPKTNTEIIKENKILETFVSPSFLFSDSDASVYAKQQKYHQEEMNMLSGKRNVGSVLTDATSIYAIQQRYLHEFNAAAEPGASGLSV